MAVKPLTSLLAPSSYFLLKHAGKDYVIFYLKLPKEPITPITHGHSETTEVSNEASSPLELTVSVLSESSPEFCFAQPCAFPCFIPCFWF